MTGKINKGFSLIELLVVVAIIGILAAVGVVAYNGYTGAAKRASTKQMHSTVVKFISSTLAKCNLGETSISLSGGASINCNNLDESTVINAFVTHFGPNGLKFKNILNPPNADGTRVSGVIKCSGHDGAVNLCSTTLEPNFSVLQCYPDFGSSYAITKKSNTIYAKTTTDWGTKPCFTLYKEISLNL